MVIRSMEKIGQKGKKNSRGEVLDAARRCRCLLTLRRFVFAATRLSNKGSSACLW